DKDGELWSASEQNEQLLVRDELRLGESEYAASAFRLWGFSAGKAFSPPSQNVIMYQRSLAVDARDPRTTWQPSLLSTLPAMLPGRDFGWQAPGVAVDSQRRLRARGEGVWRSSKTQWEHGGILPARGG
ncbi:DUF3131 domain-containing protein, partial [Enterobacter cloacae complex sp. 742-ADZ3-9B]|uniref:DUF3131 domain-containing protein n=1 Tax=Enterobacter cloacae complex sp. 742-ADZ3-9B TaxID=2511992 RepID=UPI001013B200